MGLPRKRRSARLRDYLKKNRNPVKPSTKQNKFSNTAVIGGIIKSRKSSLIHEISRHIGRSLVRHVTEECIVPPRISPCPRTGNRKASPKNKKKQLSFRYLTNKGARLPSSLPSREKSRGILQNNPRSLIPPILNYDGKCEYCRKRPATTIDHYEPLVKNGRPSGFMDDEWNRVPACKECNASKGGRCFEAWYNSNSRLRPKGAKGKRLADNFCYYDRFFRKNCMFVSIDHPFWNSWWNSVESDIDTFMDDLQFRVNEKLKCFFRK